MGCLHPVFERFPRPDYCLSLHIMPDLAAGTVGLTSLARAMAVTLLLPAVAWYVASGRWPARMTDDGQSG